MSVSKQPILPKVMINRFCRTFSIHQLLVHLHSLSKVNKSFESTPNYNLGAFLTMDKSRKIIRQKQESLFVEIMKKISDQYVQLMSKQSVDDLELFNISYSELQKFIELFYSKKRLFGFVKGVVENVERECGMRQIKGTMNREGLKKMEDKLEELQHKLTKVVHKYEQRSNFTFVQKLNYHSTINATDQHHQAKPPTQELYPEQSPLSIVKRHPRQKQTVINKIGSNCSDQSRIDNYKMQIAELKSKYYRLNCKTDGQQDADRYQGKDNSIMRTQPNEELSKDYETGPAEDMKFSIRFTRDKKTTKVSTSFSIFDKSTKNASIFVRTSTNPTIDKDPSISHTNCQQRFSFKRQSSFLKKKSSVNYKSPVNCDGIEKKVSNTVYCQSRFSIDTSSKRKSVQKRNSTINVRQSISAGDNLKRKTCFVTMRTEADIGKQENSQEDGVMNFGEQLTPTEIQNQQSSKITTNIEGQQFDRIECGDEDNKENINNQQNDENQQKILMQNYQNKRSSKLKNRRKGFSKKRIGDSQDGSLQQIAQRSESRQASGVWDQSDVRQRTYKRTSIFRTSGYFNQRNGQTKARFNNNCNKKLMYRDSSRINCGEMNSQMIENGETQRVLQQRTSVPHQARKCITTSQFSVNAKDCASLHRAITVQSRADQQEVHPFELESIMRKKYDLSFRLEDEQDDYDTNPGKLMSRMRMRVIETEVTEGQTKSRWNDECDNFGEIDFSKIVLRKINMLGQKNIDNKRNSRLEDQMEVVDF